MVKVHVTSWYFPRENPWPQLYILAFLVCIGPHLQKQHACHTQHDGADAQMRSCLRHLNLVLTLLTPIYTRWHVWIPSLKLVSHNILCKSHHVWRAHHQSFSCAARHSCVSAQPTHVRASVQQHRWTEEQVGIFGVCVWHYAMCVIVTSRSYIYIQLGI